MVGISMGSVSVDLSFFSSFFQDSFLSLSLSSRRARVCYLVIKIYRYSVKDPTDHRLLRPLLPIVSCTVTRKLYLSLLGLKDPRIF